MALNAFTDACKKAVSRPGRRWLLWRRPGADFIALATALYQAGFAVSVINPAQAHYFAKAQLKRAKNDALDAQTIAELAQALVPACWTPPPQIYYELQQRLAQRTSLLHWRTRLNNQFYALSVSAHVFPTVRERLVEFIDLLNQHVAQLDEELLELVKIEQELPAQEEPQRVVSAAEEIEQQWKVAIALLLTIPGIGLLTACWLVVATLNFSICETAQAATHYVGLAPIMREPRHEYVRRAQIGHGGHARARTQLYLATLAAVRFNPVVKSYYDRLRAAGKPMKVARCACARKLLHIAFALVTSQQPFDPTYQPTTKGEEAVS